MCYAETKRGASFVEDIDHSEWPDWLAESTKEAIASPGIISRIGASLAGSLVRGIKAWARSKATKWCEIQRDAVAQAVHYLDLCSHQDRTNYNEMLRLCLTHDLQWTKV